MIRVMLVLLLTSLPCAAQETRTLKYAPAPVDNPLKGLVPYAAKYDGRFPHSLEFNYLPLGALVVGPQQYDWKPLENLLNEIAGRGHQAVFRIYLEYPGKKDIIPAYLVKNGLKVHKYLYTETQPLPPAPIETPDYADPNLRAMLQEFIAVLGKKYDGDPRIGFITAGLLGTWGEWHTYPREELFASKDVQAEVMTAYEQAFKVTPILLRYPAGKKTWGKAPNATRRFGYHDDSFAWATLHTGKKGDEWFYMTALQEAGAVDKWKTQPIGGEIRPEAWGKVFDETIKSKQIQNFRACVDATHATWLMDSGLFEKKQSEARRKRAEDEVRHMGYEFHVPTVTRIQQGNKLTLRVELQNRGVAPFYYDWRPVYGIVVNGKVIKEIKGSGTIIGLLPGEPNRVWTDTVDAIDGAKIVLRIPNTLPNGNPIRFANAEQDRDAKGCLTLWE
jgi:hypothetical protein